MKKGEREPKQKNGTGKQHDLVCNDELFTQELMIAAEIAEGISDKEKQS